MNRFINRKKTKKKPLNKFRNPPFDAKKKKKIQRKIYILSAILNKTRKGKCPVSTVK